MLNDALDQLADVKSYLLYQEARYDQTLTKNKELEMTISADRENYDSLAKEYREARDERQRLSEVLAQERLLSTNTAKQLEEAMDEIRKLRAVLSNITEALKPVVEEKPEETTPTEPYNAPFLPPAKEPEPAPTHNVYVGAGYVDRSHEDTTWYPMLPREAEAQKDDYIPLPRAVGDEYRF